MSSYFKNFQQVDYNFGTEAATAKIQNLTQYVNINNIIKDDISLYSIYTILDGDRPDILSNKFYGSSKYHYMFYLMNDKLIESGWPLTEADIDAHAKKMHPNTTLVTQNELQNKFRIGQTITGLSSGATGTIIKKRVDFGQIIIEGTLACESDEIIQSSAGDTAQLTACTAEYNSTHHYVDGDSAYVDVSPHSGDPALYTQITFLNHYKEQNDLLKLIRLVKPTQINAIHNEIARLLKE